MQKLKYLNDKDQIGIKCPFGVTISKNVKCVIYIGSENCLRCNNFSKIKDKRVYCKGVKN